MATTAELLAQVNTAIAALIASPEVDFVEGDVEIKAGQKMTQLLQARKVLTQSTDDDVALITFDDVITTFGEDLTQRTGDNT